MTSISTSRNCVGVIGAGSFGTAVANLLARNADVLLYVRQPATAQAIQQTRTAAGYSLAPNITPTDDLAEVAARCTVLFPVVPSASFRSMMQQLAPWLQPHHVLIHGTKGLDVHWPQASPPGTWTPLPREAVKTMSEVIQEESPVHQIGCLAGPNLARELAQGQPAATVVASPVAAVITHGQQLLRSDHFQVYSSTDLLGVELCGVLKNIMAIGAGCLSGLGYGENAKGMLISRGMVEMVYLGRAMGASVRPFLGLAGVGDLVATCTSSLSRNYTVGYRLAQGTPPQQLMQNTEETAEGINTVKTIRGLLDHYQMRAPITEAMYRVLFEGLAVQEAIQYLMKYPLDIDVDFL
ncbi:MAG: NAD(P)H-dependent glycerol-3-phosphate dehydrogenase [Bacteroidota bacterium]